MEKHKSNFLVFFIYISALILITIVQSVIIIRNPEILENDSLFITFSTISNLVLYGGLFVIFIYVFRDYFRRQIEHFVKYRKRIILIIVIGIFAMYAVNIISSVILILLDAAETSENQQQLEQLLNGTLFDKISLVVFSVLFAPLVEELVFRKAILNLFHFKIGVNDGSTRYKVIKFLLAAFAVLVSGALFGFVHVTSGDFIQMIYYGFLGVTLGIIYLVSDKNIYSAIIVHFLLNLLATSFLFM